MFQDATAGYCVGIAATTTRHLMATPTIWDYNVQCATPYGNPDGPSIHYDLGAANLFVVENQNTKGDILLDIFAGCGAGHPGNTGCPRTQSNKCVDAACASRPQIFAHPT